MFDLLPDALADALGSVVADVRRECCREIEVVSAESRAIVAELKAQVFTLTAMLKGDADQQVARVSAAIATIRNGDPGQNADPQVTAEIAAKLVSDELTESIKADVDAIRGDIEAIGAGLDEKITERVAAVVADLPVPTGADPALITELVAAELVKVEHVDPDAIRSLVIAEIDVAVKALPGPVDGHTPTEDELVPLVDISVSRAIAAAPKPRNGEDGKSLQPADVADMISAEAAKAVAALPPPASDPAVIRQLVNDALLLEPAPLVIGDVLNVVDECVSERLAVPLSMIAELEQTVRSFPVPDSVHTPTAEELAPIIQDAVRAAVDELPRPKDGVGVAAINREGPRLTIELDDGRVFDAGEIVGAKGERGEAGVGVAGALIDRSGSLVVTQSDGTVLALGSVVGSNGADGKAYDYVPDDVAVTVSKAISMLAESPPVTATVTPSIVPSRPRKRITTHRDEQGNLIADVVEF